MDPKRHAFYGASPLLFSVFFFSLVSASPAAAQKIGEVPKVPPTPSAPKGTALEWVSGEGQPFWYRLPAKVDVRSRPNLLVMLHGTGLKWGWAFWNYPIVSGRFRTRDIVVAPEGLTRGQGDTFNFVQGKKDGDQVAGLIKLFRSRFPVDKVYLYGHSQGAFFCYWFAGAHTGLVDGIVAHAGNVLQVNHNDLAKNKVAIGILHGKADAVVPVDCAHRTHEIYRKQGYRHLKLYIVEGLTKRSGHWPLPKQVSEMFEWLDQVSEATPSVELSVALNELAKEAPDIFVIAASLGEARTLLRNYRGKDRKELQTRLDALREFLDEARTAHADAIKEARREAERNKYESWMAHFASAHASFVTSKGWQSDMRKLIQSAAEQNRIVAQAANLLHTKPGRGSFVQATKVAEKALLATDSYGLIMILRPLSLNPQTGVTADEVERYREAIKGRGELMAEGEKQEAAITARIAAEFREKHPELFADHTSG